MSENTLHGPLSQVGDLDDLMRMVPEPTQLSHHPDLRKCGHRHSAGEKYRAAVFGGCSFALMDRIKDKI